MTQVPEGHETLVVGDVQREDSVHQPRTNKSSVIVLVFQQLRSVQVEVLVVIEMDKFVVKHVELIVGEEIHQVDVDNVGCQVF